MGTSAIELYHEQQTRFDNPHLNIQQDFDAIYGVKSEITVGYPPGIDRLYESIARDNTVIIVGIALGDEGKGRLVDNKLEGLLEQVKFVYVVRYQGGSNAGHSIEKDGIKLALHQVPSGVLYPEVVGVMDSGMVIHPEDLQTEIEMVESKVGDLREKLYLSRDAILATDLERAEEVLNRIRQGRAKGGTGRGIGPAYAHHYDRLGLRVSHLLSEDWRQTLEEQYNRYAREFSVYDLSLEDVEVPDYKQTLSLGRAVNRSVGSKEEFIERLAAVRTWLIDRNLVTNTFEIHSTNFSDVRRGFLFEGAQSVGLHAWLGTRPDVTGSDTSAFGVMSGTGYWLPMQIQDRVGVFKITYTSSVGERQMPTEVVLPRSLDELKNPSADEQWAAYVRTEAHEYGTTTGRPRDILHLDLAMMTYNCHMSGIEVLAGTHLDIAREGEDIKVCTHYTKNGMPVRYKPGLEYQEGVVPHYITLSGWNGSEVQKAKSFEDLPENAQKFLAFIQRRTGYPLVAATTGPARENLIPIR